MKQRRLLAALAWIAVYLVVFDIAVNIIFRYPTDPRNITPSNLQQFFEYGRSVEGKLTRMTRKTREQSAPMLATGWLRNPRIKAYSDTEIAPHQRVVTVYGMSHSVQLAEDMAKIDKSLAVRSFGAPGAVPTWSYAAYLFDKEQHHSDVVILALMTRGVPLICTTSGTTNHFDAVWPYTYPRYFSRRGSLESVLPPFVSLEEYWEYFYDSGKWEAYVKWLREYDKYYDPILFGKTLLDNSSLVRMMRRAYAYASQRRTEAEVYDEHNGFNPESEEVRILLSIIKNFSEDARRNKSLPIIYIVNNIFMGDHLFRILEPALSAQNVLFLSSHEICPPNDPRNYLPDSHFVPSKNLELARAMVRIVRENISSRTSMDSVKVTRKEAHKKPFQE
jgi:hypothetical protein